MLLPRLRECQAQPVPVTFPVLRVDAEDEDVAGRAVNGEGDAVHGVTTGGGSSTWKRERFCGLMAMARRFMAARNSHPVLDSASAPTLRGRTERMGARASLTPVWLMLTVRYKT